MESERSSTRLARAGDIRVGRVGTLGTGTLACPGCDAPVALGGDVLRPRDSLRCPYCGLGGAVRDFLSLAAPTRPARVEVRLVLNSST